VDEGTTARLSHSHVERWLTPLRHLAGRHAAELAEIADVGPRADRLCELNVLEQTQQLLASDVVRNAPLRGIDLAVYSLIYDLRDGLLRDLSS